jgi:hypothetical protein
VINVLKNLIFEQLLEENEVSVPNREEISIEEKLFDYMNNLVENLNSSENKSLAVIYNQ